MIIDCHTHYTTAPLELQAYRGRQFTVLGKPVKAKLQISEEELERSMQNQFKRMKDSGIDRLLFSPQASAMGHHFGPPIVSRYWTEACNDLIARVAKRWPDKISPVCQLPQSPGVSPKEWVDELDRCVKELGFVGCNINPDMAGGREPLTPSLASDWWYPLWEKMVELDVPCTIHASASLNPAMHLTNSYYIAQHTSGAVELLRSRVFKDFPKLKIIIPHGGEQSPSSGTAIAACMSKKAWNRSRKPRAKFTGTWRSTIKNRWSSSSSGSALIMSYSPPRCLEQLMRSIPRPDGTSRTSCRFFSPSTPSAPRTSTKSPKAMRERCSRGLQLPYRL